MRIDRLGPGIRVERPEVFESLEMGLPARFQIFIEIYTPLERIFLDMFFVPGEDVFRLL